MDGPLKAAADRLVAIHRRMRSDVTTEHIAAFVADLRALTLARHARGWAFMIQMFAVEGAVEDEMSTYLNQFCESLDQRLIQMSRGAYRPGPNDDTLTPWAAALSLHGRHWVPGRVQGIPEEDLMHALWLAA
jgi:hypothetical protein